MIRRILRGALVLALGSAGACCPTTAGPTGPIVSFSGSLPGGALTYRDFEPPPGTSQMDVVVSWSDVDVGLRLYWIDASCDPLLQSGCRRFSEPIGPMATAPGTIRVIATNQGPAAGPRMRFVVENATPGRDASFTLTVAPHRAGCT